MMVVLWIVLNQTRLPWRCQGEILANEKIRVSGICLEYQGKQMGMRWGAGLELERFAKAGDKYVCWGRGWRAVLIVRHLCSYV